MALYFFSLRNMEGEGILEVLLYESNVLQVEAVSCEVIGSEHM